jgi:hypothetical protein
MDLLLGHVASVSGPFDGDLPSRLRPDGEGPQDGYVALPREGYVEKLPDREAPQRDMRRKSRDHGRHVGRGEPELQQEAPHGLPALQTQGGLDEGRAAGDGKAGIVEGELAGGILDDGIVRPRHRRHDLRAGFRKMILGHRSALQRRGCALRREAKQHDNQQPGDHGSAHARVANQAEERRRHRTRSEDLRWDRPVGGTNNGFMARGLIQHQACSPSSASEQAVSGHPTDAASPHRIAPASAVAPRRQGAAKIGR